MRYCVTFYCSLLVWLISLNYTFAFIRGGGGEETTAGLAEKTVPLPTGRC